MSDAGKPAIGTALGLGLSAMILVATRYESLFLVGSTVLALAAGRRLREAALCAASPPFPSAFSGSIPCPTAVSSCPILFCSKGVYQAVQPGLSSPGGTRARQNARSPHLFVLLLLGVGAISWRSPRGKVGSGEPLAGRRVPSAGGPLICIGRDGYRYEAYLMAIAIMVLWVQAKPGSHAGATRGLSGGRRGAGVLFGAALVGVLLLLTARSVRAHVGMVQSTTNIYQQQYQMGRFLHQYYDSTPVMANDIVVINFLHADQMLDLSVGFGRDRGSSEGRDFSRRPSRSWLNPTISAWPLSMRTGFVGRKFCRRSGNSSALGPLPTMSSVAVTRYLFSPRRPSEAKPLLAHLRAFAVQLPQGVIWREAVDKM